MKTFIHIGLPKTASTYLQRRFFPRLEDICFVSRPYTQENEAFNRLQYADASLYDEAMLEAEIDELNRRAEGARAILLSDEHFAGSVNGGFQNRGQAAERLKRVMPEAEIIVFLRGQEDFICSLYAQKVKGGMFSGHLDERFLDAPGSGFSLDDWFAGNRGWNSKKRFIDDRWMYNVETLRYSRLIEFYDALFARVHVFLYEDFKLEQAASLERLASIMGCRLPDVSRAESLEAVNRQIRDDRLRQQLARHRLSGASIDTESRVGALMTSVAARFVADRTAENRRYVQSVLVERGLYDDNRQVDRDFGLGMGRHPARYFGVSEG